jgi:hypothetical protein
MTHRGVVGKVIHRKGEPMSKDWYFSTKDDGKIDVACRAEGDGGRIGDCSAKSARAKPSTAFPMTSCSRRAEAFSKFTPAGMKS